MKESDITPKIIGASKEIAEYWKMKLEEGHWFYDEDKRESILYDQFEYVVGKDGLLTKSMSDNDGLGGYHRDVVKNWFPIPSVSDSLEKLKRLGWRISGCYETKGKIVVSISTLGSDEFIREQYFHIALLRLLLETLKQAKT